MALWGPAAALAVVLVGACSPYGGGEFACADDGQCAGGPAGGRCEPDGRCSFPDAACDSGRRYGELSGAASGTCVGATSDGGIDADDVAPFCDATDPTLVGCWEFEDSLADASGEDNHASSATAGFATGKVGKALALQADTLVTVPDTASLTPTRLTIEAWINPSQLPTGGDRMGIFDNNGQYGFFLYENRIECSATTAISATATIVTNTWTHVACTYDGTTGRVYTDGVQRAMATGNGDLGAGDSSGSVIGGNSPSGNHLIGMIDQLRVWNVALTAPQICAAASAPLCI